MSTARFNTLQNAAGTKTVAVDAVVDVNNIVANTGIHFRNRIINGDMRIDQRNAGASVAPTTTSGYSLDRWVARITQNSKLTIQQNAGSVTPPAGFSNYLGVTSSSAYSVLSTDVFTLAQAIEGFNTADLSFGSANAQSVTLSFWVRSSLTGSFGGALVNAATNRSYPFSYTISAANTWEQKTVTIAGDTSGTWLTNSSIGIEVRFGLGSGSNFTGTANVWGTANAAQPPSTVSVVGTNGATFYITGVQLEAGAVASPFERRDYGRELMMCQRYFETSFPAGTAPANATASASNYNGTQLGSFAVYVSVSLKVEKRATPTMVIYSSSTMGSPTPNQIQYFDNAGAGWTNTSAAVLASANRSSFIVASTNSATSGFSYWTAFGWATSAEL